jgi:hypothetical protein
MAEAAEELGLSVEAIRKRIQRGTIHSDKGPDGRRYVYLDAGRDSKAPDDDPLVDELRDRLRYVEGQLDLERQAHAEARQIIMQQSVTMRQLSASESSEEPVEAEADPGRVGDRDHATSPETAAQRRPWWRRMFGRFE